LIVGQGTLRHGRNGEIGVGGKELKHLIDHVALATGGWTLDGNRAGSIEEPRRYRQIESLDQALLACHTRGGHLICGRTEDVGFASEQGWSWIRKCKATVRADLTLIFAAIVDDERRDLGGETAA